MKLKIETKKVFPEEGPARYNVAAWQKADADHVVLVGREITEAVSDETPDKGKLVLFEIDEENRIVHERMLWGSIGNNLFLEDPRALVNPDNSITVGLTLLIKSDIGYSPFPAIVQIKGGAAAWKGELPSICLVHAYGPGKNLTPVKDSKFLFRPEGKDYHHKLLFFDSQDDDKQTSYDIVFPSKLEWALWRIGTTMPPLWINEKNALLIIHGITIKDGKYVYSIGRARMYLWGGKFKVKVHPEPIITPEDFYKSGKSVVKELHPNLRKVVYACGGIVKRKDSDSLYLYVNVGDTTTFEVKMSLSELKQGLF